MILVVDTVYKHNMKQDFILFYHSDKVKSPMMFCDVLFC